MRLISSQIGSLCSNQCHRFTNHASLIASLGRPDKVLTHTEMGSTPGKSTYQAIKGDQRREITAFMKYECLEMEPNHRFSDICP